MEKIKNEKKQESHPANTPLPSKAGQGGDKQGAGNKKGLLQLLARGLGFYRNSPYVKEHLREANARSGIFMSIVMMLLEVIMIVRYVIKWVIIDPKCDSIGEFFQYTGRYWELLLAAVFMLIFSVLFVRGKIKRFRVICDIFVSLFAAMCLYFGVVTSMSDFSRGRMVTCVLSMSMFVACLLIWRPYISIIILSAICICFHYLLENQVFDKLGNHLSMNEGDLMNYIVFYITAIMIAISIYHQRYREALKSESLQRAAISDELTGLPNMHRFSELARERLLNNLKPANGALANSNQGNPGSADPAFEASERENAAPASFVKETNGELIYLFLNIDNFKTFNDRYGYEGGNELLKQTGRILQEIFGQEPVARISDDHFAALTKVQGFEEKVREINHRLRESYRNEGYLTIKAGAYRPKDAEADPKLEMNKARFACGLLKNSGEKLIEEYDDARAEDYRLRQYVLNNIDRAVKEGYIKVLYQPVVWAEDGQLCGCEALARWIDPEVGFLSPGKFIPVLEECRQIHKLDRCIYETVCRKLRESMDAGLPVFPVSLNFSRLDFELMDVVGELEKLVEKYRIPREYLHVEITESALSEDTESLRKTMDILHEKGYAIWLDDFGSGYSSMNVLKDFNFDLLKIDMVFLKNFEGNQNSRKIIQSILELAKSLNMKTLTEGVETKEAVDFLHDAGCGRLQGYYYGKPMAYEEVLNGLEEGKYQLSENLI